MKRWNFVPFAGTIALFAVTGCLMALAATPCVAQMDSSPQISPSADAPGDGNYPYQGDDTFHTTGVITLVDGDRDRVLIMDPGGKEFSLDTSAVHLRLRGVKGVGDTSDLEEGMRISIKGRLLSPDIVAVNQLRVLAYPGEPASPAVTPNASPTAAPSAPTSHIRLRGTVISEDDVNGVIVVRVLDHTRTIHVDEHTDLTDITAPDDAHIGVEPGDRISVSGALETDGSVLADAISKNRYLAVTAAEIRHQIVGRVAEEADPLISRDIKVSIDGGRDVTVHVPRIAKVFRNGHRISVHDLTTADVVRVRGIYSGDAFDATQIDVLSAYATPER